MASKVNLKSSGREAALARRRAMSTSGKQALRSATTTRPTQSATQFATQSAQAERRAARRATASAPAAVGPARAAIPLTPPLSPAASPQRPVSLAAPAPSDRPGRPSQLPVTPALASRTLARQRRASLAQQGRKALPSGERVRTGGLRTAGVPSPKQDCRCGCQGQTAAPAPSLTVPAAAPRSNGTNGNGLRNKRADAALAAKPTGRLLSLNRRAALASRGKAAANTPQSVASLARQSNPTLSGRELAQQVRAQRATNGAVGLVKSRPQGRLRPNRQGATDQPWKVGVSETAAGSVVTGTKVGRSLKTTGDEPSTCRVVTGTEYMGAEIFREFCQAEPPAGVPKVRVSPTAQGNRVTGNEVGRSAKVTGDEPGTCKNITGTEYLSPEQVGAFCGETPSPGPRKVGLTRTLGGKTVSGNLVGRSPKVTGDEHGAGIQPTGTQYTAPADIGTPIANGRGAERSQARPAPVPPKVGVSQTLAGGTVTGTRVGRSERVTGDEPGTCRLVTGEQYLDRGHFQEYCQINPQPEPPVTGRSRTLKGLIVTGTQAGRSAKVTGDEPGTCKAITGTPYAGLEQAEAFCDAPARQAIAARVRPTSVMPTNRLTGQQPGIDRPRAEGGKVSGTQRGACEPVTGTPYIGADQYAAVCETEDGAGNGAQPGDADFPRAIGASPWQQFSVSTPAREAFAAATARPVTGTAYESSRHITGPFGMGTGKITGTEQFRFDARRPGPNLLVPNDAEAGATPAAVRITGEGQTAGPKVTGDDWERGERVTGTEGPSARRRNPTRPGFMGAMPPVARKRNEELPPPVSRVTGSAGSTERGSLVTYSGGARG